MYGGDGAIFFVARVDTGYARRGKGEVPRGKSCAAHGARQNRSTRVFFLRVFSLRSARAFVRKMDQKVPSDVTVKFVPVAFNASMKPLQQLFYSLEALDRLDLHGKVFNAIHEEKKRLFTKTDIITWVAAQGVDRAKFESVYDSFGVVSKSGRADQLVTAYKVQGTPSMAVGGRFLTSPSEAGGYQETIDVSDSLIRQLRAK